MPCACATACSNGCVMKPASVCASAPKYAVVSVTTAFSVFGYCRTDRSLSARRPSTRISALTTIAQTGFLIKASVKFMTLPYRFPFPIRAAVLGRTAKGSVFLRFGVRTVRRLHLVVDRDRRTDLELDLAAGDDFAAFVESFVHRNSIATCRTGHY